MLDPSSLPDGLPPGRLITPDSRWARGEPVTGPVLWVSDEPVPDIGAHWGRLHHQHPRTGLWPLLLTTLEGSGGGSGRPWHNGELAPVAPELAERMDPDQFLAEWWGSTTGAADDEFDFEEDAVNPVPFRSWPGLAAVGPPGTDPDQHADALVTAPDGARRLTRRVSDPHLGLVPAADSAGTIAACGWMTIGTEHATAVVRSWQQRFGVRLCALGFDNLGLSVAWPPRTREHAQHVAAEHYAFCGDIVDQSDEVSTFDEYATTLVNATAWWFWWD
jgi:hypothetical protein